MKTNPSISIDVLTAVIIAVVVLGGWLISRSSFLT